MAAEDHNARTALLPPDGTLIQVSPWRQQLAWIPTILYSFLAVWSPIYALQKGVLTAGLIGVLGFGLAAAVSIRITMKGVMTEARGVKARGTWRTYHWRWDEINHFELRERGNIPRFRVHLHDGKTKKFVGFFARSPVQEERCHALFKALEERLDAEHTKADVPSA